MSGTIAERLAGERILLTGSTGFLAKALLEKLLRALPDVERIYLLVRPRGAEGSSEKRVESEVLGSHAFARLRAKTDTHSQPNWRVNGSLRNVAAFSQAFNCVADAPMRPANACSVW